MSDGRIDECKKESTAVAIFIVAQDAGRLAKALAKKKKKETYRQSECKRFSVFTRKEEERPNYVRVAEPKKPTSKNLPKIYA